MMLRDNASLPRELRLWLWIAVSCLAIGGLYALPLAAARGLKNVTEAQIQALFNIVLAVHVDLSIFLWFLAMLIVGWRLMPAFLMQPRWVRLPYFKTASLWLFAGGALLMALSPLIGEGEGLRSNYIPMLTHPAFLLSLVLLACGLCLALVEALIALSPARILRAAFQRPLELEALCAYGMFICAIIVLVSLWAFYAAAERSPPMIQGEDYYNMVFWAGGHAIQFAYSQAAMVAWLLVLRALGLTLPFGNRFYAVLFSINLFSMLYVPLPFYDYEVDSQAFQACYTHLMIWVNGIAPTVLMLCIGWAVVRGWGKVNLRKNALWNCLLSSITLFLYGGVLALMIDGQNVVIPAHYHGSIVGITLAFMGMAYVLLPALGYRAVERWRIARYQPVILCLGQIIHVSALAWSGGYGVLRKTVGTDGYPAEVRLAMGLLGGGSGLASLGGALFVIVIIMAWRRSLKTSLDN